MSWLDAAVALYLNRQQSKKPNTYDAPLTKSDDWLFKFLQNQAGQIAPYRDFASNYTQQFVGGLNGLIPSTFKFQSDMLKDQQFAGGMKMPQFNLPGIPASSGGGAGGAGPLGGGSQGTMAQDEALRRARNDAYRESKDQHYLQQNAREQGAIDATMGTPATPVGESTHRYGYDAAMQGYGNLPLKSVYGRDSITPSLPEWILKHPGGVAWLASQLGLPREQVEKWIRGHLLPTQQPQTPDLTPGGTP